MVRCNWKTAALVAALAVGSGSLFVRAADDAKPATGGAPKSTATASGTEKPKKAPRLVKPWSELKTLSEDQTDKIAAIHRKALDEINAIKDKEEKDCTALLTDAQKSELKAAEEADDASKKTTPKKEKGDKPAPASPAKP